MRARYVTVDVFTHRPFGGNPLAVVPDARGMSGELMQQVAREFNYSESTFVLPSEDPDNSCKVRIFTPEQELPFAGHPNVGTAYVLAASGDLGQPVNGQIRARFEESAGIVAVDVQMRGKLPTRCEIKAPQALSYYPGPAVEAVAAGVSLSADDVVTERHLPVVASTGIAFLLVELESAQALARAHIDSNALDAAMPDANPLGIHLYTRDTGDTKLDLRARMFAPRAAIAEDPATGSANCALAGVLADLDSAADGERRLRIGQGFEMGRPSRMELTTRKHAGVVQEILLAGECAPVMDGVISLD